VGRLHHVELEREHLAADLRLPRTVSRRRRPDGVRPPAVVVVIAVVGLVVFLVAPLAGLVERAPWGDLWSTLTAPDTRTALRLSLQCSLAATGLAVLFGLPIAWV